MSGMTFIVSMFASSITYAAVTVFALGVLYRAYTEYYLTPQPLVIPQTPQPTTAFGVFMRMAGDILFFRSLSKGTTFLFITSWIFHVTFFLLIVRHLRYFFYPVPDWVVMFNGSALFLGCVMFLSLFLLLVRRIVDGKVSYVTSVADYLVLLLLLAIVGTGILMRFEPFRPDIVGVKAFMLELLKFSTPLKMLTLHPAHAPVGSLMFLVHLSLVCMLLIFFPFSKLMHAVGVFFSPTRNMVNDPRSTRYVNPWAPEGSSVLLSERGGDNE